ncbi:DotI/IcmL/TraM family protein [Legionella clemsonensis]|uniref:Macrophage killing protein with similarity to conjugation protein n=1 Tax=Legionella clemsonensis TaxID=1867846 RepID=A0A222P5R9_9GAMM|nr:DotI/IcmL/TraM family protein [Legionella clemsonensis]ASQ47157.1 Macrophage killing protein with similarity to conjugation protein [Legionella clemsonensis]
MRYERLILLIFIYFFIPSTHYGNDIDYDVKSWTQETLMATLSINYTETPADFANLQRRYTVNAWSALHNFFNKEINEIREKHFTTHPSPLTPPIIVEKGVTSGIAYWRVNQSFMISEMNSRLDFSLIVIRANNPPFIIQSVNVVRH